MIFNARRNRKKLCGHTDSDAKTGGCRPWAYFLTFPICRLFSPWTRSVSSSEEKDDAPFLKAQKEDPSLASATEKFIDGDVAVSPMTQRENAFEFSTDEEILDLVMTLNQQEVERVAEYGATDNDDMDWTRVTDIARMTQTVHDDSVVALAIHKYENFHGLTHGSVYYNEIAATSAGVQGWAEADLFDDSNYSSTNSPCPTTCKAKRAKGDAMEAQMLQRVLLQSMGVRVLDSPSGAIWPLETETEIEYEYDEESTEDEHGLHTCKGDERP